MLFSPSMLVQPFSDNCEPSRDELEAEPSELVLFFGLFSVPLSRTVNVGGCEIRRHRPGFSSALVLEEKLNENRESFLFRFAGLGEIGLTFSGFCGMSGSVNTGLPELVGLHGGGLSDSCPEVKR